MGKWGNDLIGGDDTLECAMLFLAAAGIGPPNLEDDIRTVPMFFHSVPLCQEGEYLFMENLNSASGAELARDLSLTNRTPDRETDLVARGEYSKLLLLLLHLC